MKMQVIADAEGNIVATAQAEKAKGAPVSVGLIPEPGQTLHVLKVPKKLAKAKSVARLHRDYRVAVKSGVAKLAKSAM